MNRSTRTRRTRTKTVRCKACLVLASLTVMNAEGLCLSCKDQMPLWDKEN